MTPNPRRVRIRIDVEGVPLFDMTGHDLELAVKLGLGRSSTGAMARIGAMLCTLATGREGPWLAGKESPPLTHEPVEHS